MLQARQAAGPFMSLLHLCERVDSRTAGRKTIEALVRCGACDCFGQTRATLFAAIERTLTRAASLLQDRQRGQSSLFGMLGEEKNEPAQKNGHLPEWPQSELL